MVITSRQMHRSQRNFQHVLIKSCSFLVDDVLEKNSNYESIKRIQQQRYFFKILHTSFCYSFRFFNNDCWSCCAYRWHSHHWCHSSVWKYIEQCWIVMKPGLGLHAEIIMWMDVFLLRSKQILCCFQSCLHLIQSDQML